MFGCVWVELDKSTNDLDNLKLDVDLQPEKKGKKKKKSLTCDFTFDSKFLLFLQVFFIF